MSLFRRVLGLGLMAMLLLTGCDEKKDLPRRGHYEEGAKVSYNPPTDWALREMPGLKYKVAIGSKSQGVPPTLTLVDEVMSCTLKKYLEITLLGLEKSVPEATILSQDAFETEDGIQGIKVSTKQTKNAVSLSGYLYFFNSLKGRKYVLECSCSTGAADQTESLFDAAAYSFRMHE